MFKKAASGEYSPDYCVPAKVEKTAPANLLEGLWSPEQKTCESKSTQGAAPPVWGKSGEWTTFNKDVWPNLPNPYTPKEETQVNAFGIDKPKCCSSKRIRCGKPVPFPGWGEPAGEPK